VSDYCYDDYEEERLVRQAVLALIERHRDEYLALVGETHEERIAELQAQARKDKQEIARLKEKVERTIEERDRWRSRLDPDRGLVPDR
jgi:hypothetical protein